MFDRVILRLSRSSSSTRARWYSSRNPLDRPSPPPLPRSDQREFEELVRAVQAPLQSAQSQRGSADAVEADFSLHPDARKPLPPDFEGEVNPATGEQGGPKREPVGKWGESDGDWSFKGRVSDF
ncbi:hypothetical protein WOLCODRAFT_138496 [Wolfiporia cocos MD-104 SS10]|uniref:Succinate dehydrogenase assembly factor 4, mitochondrial n=1 Tax=Wolfiporia cocos (strain MD-104) TaxID=742152 RepID=A0A2H3K0M0_WOLCO|nr:hypothetical protein WOLCODRAFT_138496 [Wolfiporia cocos MD-104 SS10]